MLVIEGSVKPAKIEQAVAVLFSERMLSQAARLCSVNLGASY